MKINELELYVSVWINLKNLLSQNRSPEVMEEYTHYDSVCIKFKKRKISFLYMYVCVCVCVYMCVCVCAYIYIYASIRIYKKEKGIE